MKHPNPTGKDDTAPAAEPARPSAIERQIAAAALLQKQRNAPNGKNDDHDGENGSRTPLIVGAVALVVVIAGGAALLLPELGLVRQMSFWPLQNDADRIIAMDHPPTAAPTPQPILRSAPESAPPPAPSPQTPANISEPAPQPNAPVAAQPGPQPQTLPPDALSGTPENITLRDRPELVEQMVGLYRSQLATSPNDASALDAIARLRERTLSELEAVIAEGNPARAVTSLVMTLRLFPELAENPRYQASAARVEQMHRQVVDAAPAATANPPASAAAPAPTTPAPTPAPTSAPAEAAPVVEKPAAIEKPAIAEKPAGKEKFIPSKPDVRIVSATPGRMEAGRFVPVAGGKVFMVEVSYRNFARRVEGELQPELVMLLGNTGDRQVLAEAPIELYGDRGTKAIPLETVVPGYAGEIYKVNFILNGALLSSQTVRLSSPVPIDGL